MLDEMHLSELIGDIYDAALNPSLWIDALRSAAGFVGGPAASVRVNSSDMTSNAAHVFGIEPHYQQLYLEKYAVLDPTATCCFSAGIEEPTASGDVMPYDEFLETRFFREWVKPQGLVDSANAVLDRSATTVASFTVFRHERDGVVDEKARGRMRLIVPHVRRATLVGGVIDLKRSEAATFAETLDGLSAGVILVDADARVVHANAAGQAMLDAGDVFRAAEGRLLAADAQTEETLRKLFSGSDNAAMSVAGTAVSLLARNGERHVAHVLPLTSGERRRAGITYAAVAALFVRKAALEAPAASGLLASTFGLTPSELRVLLGVVDVGGVPDVAVALGVAESTVKTHLGRLFEKTGAGRQADLVKLVAGYASPLASRLVA